MSALIAFIESVPALVKLVQTFVDYWQGYQYSKLLEKYQERDLKRLSLIEAIKKAENDDVRKALIRMLYEVSISSSNTKH
jgi:hypothetical protein